MDMQVAQPPESGELDLSQYEGKAIVIQGHGKRASKTWGKCPNIDGTVRSNPGEAYMSFREGVWP
jgi:hypothetical protein